MMVPMASPRGRAMSPMMAPMLPGPPIIPMAYHHPDGMPISSRPNHRSRQKSKATPGRRRGFISVGMVPMAAPAPQHRMVMDPHMIARRAISPPHLRRAMSPPLRRAMSPPHLRRAISPPHMRRALPPSPGRKKKDTSWKWDHLLTAKSVFVTGEHGSRKGTEQQTVDRFFDGENDGNLNTITVHGQYNKRDHSYDDLYTAVQKKYEERYHNEAVMQITHQRSHSEEKLHMYNDRTYQSAVHTGLYKENQIDFPRGGCSSVVSDNVEHRIYIDAVKKISDDVEPMYIAEVLPRKTYDVGSV